MASALNSPLIVLAKHCRAGDCRAICRQGHRHTSRRRCRAMGQLWLQPAVRCIGLIGIAIRDPSDAPVDPALVNGLFKCVENKASVCCAACAPADNPPRTDIDDEGHIYEPMPASRDMATQCTAGQWLRRRRSHSPRIRLAQARGTGDSPGPMGKIAPCQARLFEASCPE